VGILARVCVRVHVRVRVCVRVYHMISVCCMRVCVCYCVSLHALTRVKHACM